VAEAALRLVGGGSSSDFFWLEDLWADLRLMPLLVCLLVVATAGWLEDLLRFLELLEAGAETDFFL
jgi:hypothetical protein